MAAKTQYLTFYVHTTDAALARELQDQYPDGFNMAPLTAATTYAAPFKLYTAATGAPPYTWTPYIKSIVTNNLPLNVAKFTKHVGGFLGFGGDDVTFYWMGRAVLVADPDADVNAPIPSTTTPELELAPMATRQFCEGFELPGLAFTGGWGTGHYQTRDASRHTGGWGLAIRGVNGSGKQISGNEFSGALASTVWLRFYARWRRAGNATVMLFRWHHSRASNSGAALGITAGGNLAIGMLDGSAVLNVVGTYGQLVIDEWSRIDALLDLNVQTASGAGSGAFRLYQDGVKLTTLIRTAQGGTGFVDIGQVGGATNKLSFLDVGTPFATPLDEDLELDIDDMIGGEIPVGRLWDSANSEVLNTWRASAPGGIAEQYDPGDIVYYAPDDHVYKCIATNSGAPPPINGAYWHRYEGLDWLNGSKVVGLRPSSLSPNHNSVAYPYDYRLLLHSGAIHARAEKMITTTTGALAAALVDVAPANTDPQALGVAAIKAERHAHRTAIGNVTTSIGYAINGAAAVDVSGVAENDSPSAYGAMYRPAAVVNPLALTSLEVRHTSSATAGTEHLRALHAQAELIGLFGSEDAGAQATGTRPAFPANVGQHNAPYPNTPWAIDAVAAPPFSAFIVLGGTYVGNGTGQNLTFRTPVHWFRTRPLSTTASGTIWWSSMHSAVQLAAGPAGDGMIQAMENRAFAGASGEDDQQQEFIVRIAGANAESNQAAVTYQWIAVCDPGGRYMHNGAFTHKDTSGAAARLNHLANPNFTPEFVWTQGELFGADPSVTNYLGMKSPGHAAASLTRPGTAVVNNALTAGQGTLESQYAFHNIRSGGMDQWAYSAWRRHDGNNDPGEAAVVSFGAYTGDGAASRTLTVGTGGKRPLAAFVTPEISGGTPYYRDVSHTLTNSHSFAGAGSTTAITGGGIDSITVGTTLNSSSTVYHYFILWGGTTAGNAGWSTNGEYFPVDPTSPADGPWPADLLVEPTEVIPGEDGAGVAEPVVTAPDDITTDLATACVTYSTRVVNIALSRVGISKPIANLATELSEPAEVARLHYGIDVLTVLEDFAWPFATRYAALDWVAGTADAPVNDDWTYSYRAPVDMVYARRIVGQQGEGRDYDPNPLGFRRGSDASGHLIYSNASNADVDVVLEYTYRPACAATAGDGKFRSALAWKLAASLALPLARDREKAVFCQTMYDIEIADAKVNAANQDQKPKGGDAEWITGR